MTDEVFVGDTPTFTATIKEDDVVVSLAGNTLIQFRLEDPDGISTVKAGTLTTDGTDGKYFYTFLAADLDQAGNWRLQGNVTLASGWTGHTTLYLFKVLDHLT